MSKNTDKEVIDSFMSHGSTRKEAESKLEKVKEILKQADALEDARGVQKLFEKHGDKATHLINQITEKIKESQTHTGKRHRSPTPESDSDIEEWSKLPGATLKKSRTMNSKMFDSKGGKTRKNRKSKQNRKSSKNRKSRQTKH